MLSSYKHNNTTLAFGFSYSVHLAKCTLLTKLFHCVSPCVQRLKPFTWHLFQRSIPLIGQCTNALAHDHVLNLSVALCPFKSTLVKNLGICCHVMESSHFISCHRNRDIAAFEAQTTSGICAGYASPSVCIAHFVTVHAKKERWHCLYIFCKLTQWYIVIVGGYCLQIWS